MVKRAAVLTCPFLHRFQGARHVIFLFVLKKGVFPYTYKDEHKKLLSVKKVLKIQH